MRRAVEISLTGADRKTLERWARGRSVAVRLAMRAKIVLMAGDGALNKQIAEALGVQQRTVGLWRTRFAAGGLAGIEKDAPRGGRKPTRQRNQIRRIIEATLHETPAHATHWSTRSLGEHLGVSSSMVQRVWKAHNLKPFQTRGFKLSRDPLFVEKLVDIVGLYRMALPSREAGL